MTKEIVGKVSEEEKIEILGLYERKMGINELLQTFNNDSEGKLNNDAFYEKLVTDMGKTSRLFEKWWNDMGQQYKFKNMENSPWYIDFDTNEIYIVLKD